MPIRKLRLTTTEDREYRNSLSMLEGMGIPIGCTINSPREPARITLEQTEYESARIYEMPLNEVVVVVPARMTILKSGLLITDAAIVTALEDCPLYLCDPEESSSYVEQIGGLYHRPPTVLNHSLLNDLPLRCHRQEGVIIAHGYTSVPRECHEETLIRVKLLLTDERGKELSFEFGGWLSRSAMRKREKQRQRERHAIAQSPGEWGLYQPKRGQSGEGYLHQPERKQPGDQKIVWPDPPSSSGNLAVSITQPVTQETRQPDRAQDSGLDQS